MKLKKSIAAAAVSLAMVPAASPAAENTADTKIQIGAMASIENGQFVRSNYAGASLPYKPWINKECTRLSLRATLSDHVQFIVAPEITMWFDNFDWHQMGAEAFAFPFSSHTTVSLANAQGIMTYGDKDDYTLEFAAGVMPYKYNNEVKNLGEYLFRSGCHPAFVVTSFDNAYATMTGLKIGLTRADLLSLDLFLSTETQFLPTLDWSVSLLAGYKPVPCLEFGAGVMFDRLLPVDTTRESPSGPGNEQNRYFTEDRDTGHFSFSGTKVMARFTFDPLALFTDDFFQGMFGKEDCKIYGEAAVLGVRSITAYDRILDPITGLPLDSGLMKDPLKNYYSNIKKRIPVMVGFNLPTFSGFFEELGEEEPLWRLFALDYLSLEVEWYGWPYPLGYGDVNNFRVMYPIPPSVPDFPGGDPLAYEEKDNWKFSVNFKKTVIKGFSIAGQVARDHSHYDAYYTKYNTGYFSTEAFTLPGDWGWWLKLQYAL
ncbi:MAG: hypothetical protein JW699_06640 [Chitinispirillaceae bacterium]|nr:hypothetical protein [Chitinispirillaceae bacterium]